MASLGNALKVLKASPQAALKSKRKWPCRPGPFLFQSRSRRGGAREFVRSREECCAYGLDRERRRLDCLRRATDPATNDTGLPACVSSIALSFPESPNTEEQIRWSPTSRSAAVALCRRITDVEREVLQRKTIRQRFPEKGMTSRYLLRKELLQLFPS